MIDIAPLLINTIVADIIVVILPSIYELFLVPVKVRETAISLIRIFDFKTPVRVLQRTGVLNL